MKVKYDYMIYDVNNEHHGKNARIIQEHEHGDHHRVGVLLCPVTGKELLISLTFDSLTKLDTPLTLTYTREK